MSEPPKHHLGHRLAGYIDGELAPGARQLVAAHLAMCSTCRVAAVIESRTKAGLRDLGEPAPSNDLMASLLNVPGSAQPSAATDPGSSGSAFPTAGVKRRSVPTAPLLAAGVASVAALTVASAWLGADGAPQDPESGLRQASTGVENFFDDGPDALPTGPHSSFTTVGTGPATPGLGRPAFVEVLRLR